MRRNFITSIIAAALLPVGSLWATPHTNSAAQFLSQINEQAYQIQNDADNLERYVRSNADAWTVNAGLTFGMVESAQKLMTLLDQVASQPGATNETRAQVQKMKSAAAQVAAFSSSALTDLGAHAIALHSGNVFTDTNNIQELCTTIRSTAQDLLAH